MNCFIMKSLVFLSLFYSCYGIVYDRYSGNPSTKEDILRYANLNSTFWCTVDIDPCDPKEGRRVDGSCNNLNHPVRGAGHTPFMRRLSADYGESYGPRKAASGEDLPPPRRVRTNCLAEGSVSSSKITQLTMYYTLFFSDGLTSLHDILNYVLERNCCSEEGMKDPQCIPSMIPDDDPVYGSSDKRCLNLTIPKTFQTFGCIKDTNTIPSRIVFNTPINDLVSTYGYSPSVLQRFRVLESGMLKYETENGKIWPPSTTTAPNECILNEGPTETRCHDAPNPGFNSLLGNNFFAVMFWRQHNRIARQLSQVNPCWDDQKLFVTAKDINIAISLQIYIYELLPTLLGKENLEKDGVISKNNGFRDNFYDPTMPPQLYLEYLYTLRYFHTMQEGIVKMYDTDGTCVNEIPIVNLTLRTGYISKSDNMVYITQGSFRQGSAAADKIVDPFIANKGLGAAQDVLDVFTSDLSKGRYFGFPPYCKYREYYFNDFIECWEDLKGIISPENIEKLKKTYKDVKDIDLLAGIWMEEHIPGGMVSSLVYKTIVDQVVTSIRSDRHYYENENRPDSFTLHQLLEIRKITIARVLCDNGDLVSEIQPSAFLRIGPGNQLVDCSEIKQIDYSMWKDATCSSDSI